MFHRRTHNAPTPLVKSRLWVSHQISLGITPFSVQPNECSQTHTYWCRCFHNPIHTRSTHYHIQTHTHRIHPRIRFRSRSRRPSSCRRRHPRIRHCKRRRSWSHSWSRCWGSPIRILYIRRRTRPSRPSSCWGTRSRSPCRCWGTRSRNPNSRRDTRSRTRYSPWRSRCSRSPCSRSCSRFRCGPSWTGPTRR